MSSEEPIAELMQRVRRGDPEAAATLVRQYEPLIRRMVRLKLEDKRLSRVFESMDVCQSVLGSFFVRAAAGQYDLNEPGQLINLLISITRNKVAGAARREYRQKRDRRRITEGDSQAMAGVAGKEETPSDILAGRELLERARALLRDDEREIAALRAAGCAWEEVATKLGGTAQARRVQFMRAMDRVTKELGLDQ